MKGLASAALLLLASITLALPLSTHSDPAYGLLRTFGNSFDVMDFRAHDIEVDEEGIYVVGAARLVKDGKGWMPFLIVLDRDHTLKCYRMFGLQPAGQPFSDGVATSVEANNTHVIVAGYFMMDIVTNLFVAAFSKEDCSLTSTYAAIVALKPEARSLIDLYGEGIDLAMDETGIYALSGLTVFKVGGGEKTAGFLLIRLDPYLTLKDHVYYYAWDPGSDFATSLALGDESIYIMGGTGIDFTSKTLYADGLFILQVAKDDLITRNATILRSIDYYAINSEILVDEDGYVYVVATEEKPGARDNIAAVKLDSQLNIVWWQRYTLFLSYAEAMSSPPEHIASKFDYAVSAAVSGSKLFIGGYVLSEHQDEKGSYYSPHGIVFAVDGSTGAALYAFKIQGFDASNYPVRVSGVDAYDGCAYLAGVSGRYRLEYVFMNSLNLSLSLPTSPCYPNHFDMKPSGKDYSYEEYKWGPIFDTDQSSTGVKEYGFYGVFCDSSFLEHTTVTSTSYTTVTSTATETSTSYTTVTSTSYTTVTSTAVETGTSYTLEHTTVTSTSYTTVTSTATETRTSTERTTATSYVQTTLTRVIRVVETRVATTYLTSLIESTIYSTSLVFHTVVDRAVETLTRTETATTYVTETSPRLILTTKTMLQNKTQIVTVSETRTADGGFVSLPPWFFPLFFAPIPFLALLGRRRRYRMVIRESVASPPGWREGDPPVFSDDYLYPSVLSLGRGSVVEFVNNDSVEHVVVAYDGPPSGRFVSEPIKPGSKWVYRFREPGIYLVTSRRKPFIGGLIRIGE